MGHENRHKLAALIYAELIKVANSKTTVTYGNLASSVGRDPTKEGLAVSSSLKSVHKWCAANNYPSIDSLVVNQKTGEVGDWLGSQINPASERERVFAFRWDRVPSPTTTDFGSA